MTKKRLLTGIINAFIGILFLIFFISLGLVVAIHCRPLYYMHMDKLSSATGYSIDEIKANYDALIDYYKPFSSEELMLPTLHSSESGIFHFKEVKVIFNGFFVMLLITPFLIGILIFIQHKRTVNSYLLTSPIIICFAPIIVGLLCAIDFDKAFTLFHQIVFNNEAWYFDPVTDPIIDLLPQSFFLQCAVILIVTVLTGCFILLSLYMKLKRKHYSV